MEKRERNILLKRIKEWQTKAQLESDPFNKYISLFIAYNIFYNLYAKTENSSIDLAGGDRARSIAPLSLLSDTTQVFQSIEPELEEYVKPLPIFKEEYWPNKRAHKKVAISETLKSALNERNEKKVIEMLIKWLYKVRCNLIHGDKDYNYVLQKKLLAKSSILLDQILPYFIESYIQRYV